MCVWVGGGDIYPSAPRGFNQMGNAIRSMTALMNLTDILQEKVTETFQNTSNAS